MSKHTKSSKMTTRRSARSANHPLQDAIITRKKAAQMNLQLRPSEGTLQKLTNFLNNPAHNMKKNEPQFKLDDITNMPVTKTFSSGTDTNLTFSRSQSISRNTFDSLPSCSNNPSSQLKSRLSQPITGNTFKRKPSCGTKLQSFKNSNHSPIEQDSCYMKKRNRRSPHKTNNHILNDPILVDKAKTDNIKPYITIKKCSNRKKSKQGFNKNETTLQADHECYPNISRRKVKLKDNWLNPKHDYKIICRVDGVLRRKLFVPKKGIQLQYQKPGSNLRQALCSDLDVKELVRITDDQGLDEEDFMEILTCPSPVWWESPSDEDYLEDAIPLQIAINMDQNVIDEELKKEETKTHDNIGEIPILDVKINESDEKFMKKRSKLEQVLGNMKSSTKLPPCKGFNCEDIDNKLSKNLELNDNKCGKQSCKTMFSSNTIVHRAVVPKKTDNKELEIDNTQHDHLDINKVAKINNSSCLPDIEKYFNGQKDMAVISKVIPNIDQNNGDNVTNNNDDENAVVYQSDMDHVEIIHRSQNENNSINQVAVADNTENHTTIIENNIEIISQIIDITDDKRQDIMQVTFNENIAMQNKNQISNAASVEVIDATKEETYQESYNALPNQCENDISKPDRSISTSSDDLHLDEFRDDDMLKDLENMNIPISQQIETSEIIEITDDEPVSDKPTSTIDSPLSSISTHPDSDCASLARHNLDSISDTNITFIFDEDVVIDRHKECNETDDSGNKHSNEFNSDKLSNECNKTNNTSPTKLKDARRKKIRNAYSSLLLNYNVQASISDKSLECRPNKVDPCTETVEPVLNESKIKYCHVCSSIYDSEICTYCEKKKMECNVP